MFKYLMIKVYFWLNLVIENISLVVLHSNNKYISDFAIVYKYL